LALQNRSRTSGTPCIRYVGAVASAFQVERELLSENGSPHSKREKIQGC
jgi:hypothetical protein